jgi:hypothetical protein
MSSTTIKIKKILLLNLFSQLAEIWRSDGIAHLGPRTPSQQFNTFELQLSSDNVWFGENFLQIGNFRIADIDGHHASIAHVSSGYTIEIFTADSRQHYGPRTDYTANNRAKCHLRFYQKQGSGGALSLSSYLASTTSVVMTVSFVIATFYNTTALNLISLTGLRFSNLNATAATASCSNINPSNVSVSAVFIPSSSVLLLKLSAAATPALATTAIVCKVAGFTNTAAAAASAVVSVSTLDAYGLMLQTQGGVVFPAVFQHLGSGGALSVSNYLAKTTNVVMTVSFFMVPDLNTTALKLLSLTGMRFSNLNATAAPASCSNLNPSNIGVSAIFSASVGVLLLNLSAAATAALPTAAIVCKVAGFTNADASPFFSGGDGFIQIGDWRFGRTETRDNHHFSFSHRNGRTSIILRSDGGYFSGTGRLDLGHWRLPISWTSSTDNVYDLENLPNVLFGTSWIDFGPNIRLGTFDNVHLCVSFRQTCCQNEWGHFTFGIHTAGIDAHK